MILKKLTFLLLASLSCICPKNSKEKKNQSKKSLTTTMKLYHQKILLQEFGITNAFLQLLQIVKTEAFMGSIFNTLGVNIHDVANITLNVNFSETVPNKNNNLEESANEDDNGMVNAKINEIIITKNNNEIIVLNNQEQLQLIIEKILQTNPNIMINVSSFVQKNAKIIQQVIQENQMIAAIPNVIHSMMVDNNLNQLDVSATFDLKSANIIITII